MHELRIFQYKNLSLNTVSITHINQPTQYLYNLPCPLLRHIFSISNSFSSIPLCSPTLPPLFTLPLPTPPLHNTHHPLPYTPKRISTAGCTPQHISHYPSNALARSGVRTRDAHSGGSGTIVLLLNKYVFIIVY